MRVGTAIPRGLASTVPLLIALVGCGARSATPDGSVGGAGVGGPTASGGTAADGSRWVESLDFKAFQADANVVRDGTLAPAARLRWNYSPGCRGVQPPRRTSTRCQFEPVQNQLDVRWDDPYTTPIRR